MEKRVCSSSSQVVKKYRSTADCGITGENQSKGAAEMKRDKKRGEDWEREGLESGETDTWREVKKGFYFN